MTLKTLAMFAAGTALAGCCTCADRNDDPCIGNWGVALHYKEMNAAHFIISRDAQGVPHASVLYRCSSPTDERCEIDGNRFRIFHRHGFVLAGEVVGDRMTGTVDVVTEGEWFKKAQDNGPFTGWRNPPVCPKASVSRARFGEPIDLLKDGLAGWRTMDPKAKFGWSFKDGVLSNKLGLKPDGSWAGGGANLVSVRDDFFDFRLDYDVRVPKGSNSGVYLRGRYEIQTIDSFGKAVDPHNMAALYGRITPAVAAERPAGEWQHVTVTLYRRHVTVVLNGVTIIDDQPVEGVTGGAIDANEFVAGPIYLQGDHSDADYRNMILRPAL